MTNDSRFTLRTIPVCLRSTVVAELSISPPQLAF
jgi:hypothetical protein